MKKLATIILLTSLTSFTHAKAFQHHHEEIGQTSSDLGISKEVEKQLNSHNKNFNQREPFFGLPLRYPTFANPQAENNIGLAMYHTNGQPYVIYGPRAAQRLGVIQMGFVIQHEYAHHDLGHRGSSHPVTEAQADCYATKKLVQYGEEGRLGENYRMNILEQVILYFRNEGCHYDPRTPIQNVRDSHPCGIQRAQIVFSCMQEALSEYSDDGIYNDENNNDNYDFEEEEDNSCGGFIDLC